MFFLVKKQTKKTWFKKIVFFFHSDCNIFWTYEQRKKVVSTLS